MYSVDTVMISHVPSSADPGTVVTWTIISLSSCGFLFTIVRMTKVPFSVTVYTDGVNPIIATTNMGEFSCIMHV